MLTKKDLQGYDDDFVRSLSIEVYKRRLEDNCAGDVARLEADAKAQGRTLDLSGRAASYDVLTRCYLAALGIPKPGAKP